MKAILRGRCLIRCSFGKVHHTTIKTFNKGVNLKKKCGAALVEGVENENLVLSTELKTSTRNVSFLIFLWWPIYLINSVDKTKCENILVCLIAD